MDYAQVKVDIVPYSQQEVDITIALLAELDFESFVETESGFNAYIPSRQLENIDLNAFFANLPNKAKLSFCVTTIKSQNWNKQWESNFEPIAVENLCRIMAPFHQSEEGYEMEITIEPKMAFGTGHHQTTWLMIKELFTLDLKNKTVLDMGCGTGILAIVAEKLGASRITAIDIDTWAFENTIENIQANGCIRIEPFLGSSSLLVNQFFDVILANINLNILLNDIPIYTKSLTSKGILLLSGILLDDIPQIKEVAKKSGLILFSKSIKDNWVALGFLKS